MDPSNSSHCIDIDECAIDPTLCGNNTCVNEYAGYHCDCQDGFEPDFTNSGTCVGESLAVVTYGRLESES